MGQSVASCEGLCPPVEVAPLPPPRPGIVRDELRDRMLELRERCEDGERRACVRLGIIIVKIGSVARPGGVLLMEIQVNIAGSLAKLHAHCSLSLRKTFRLHGIIFATFLTGTGETDWHNPPQRLLVLWLTGEVEFETSDGDIRRLPAGSVVLAEDTTGKGHITRHPPQGQLVVHVAIA